MNSGEKGSVTSTIIGVVVFLVVAGVVVYILQQKPVEVTTETGGQQETIIAELGMSDTEVGTGPEAENGDILLVHYVGTFEDGSVFDSSYDREEPLELQLGVTQVIQGWHLGLLGMKVGGKRRLEIPPELAYGEAGRPEIPSNSTLIFEIELLNIEGK